MGSPSEAAQPEPAPSEAAQPEPAQPGSSGLGAEGMAAVPGLVRIAASAWWHTTGWAMGTSVRAGRRVLGVVVAPQKAGDLVEDFRSATRETVRNMLDLADGQARSRPTGAGDAGQETEAKSSNGAAPNTLRDEGEQLLRRSRDVNYSEDAHPAYGRILSELAPDEGRILHLLMLKGPQPAVDVRTGGPIGMVSSRLVAPGLTMIGARAGCRYVERTPSYLHNLFRLGLIWFSRETLRDPLPYQVLEAQPDVLAAIHSVKYAKLVRRSIHLTPFGEDFCRVSLWPDPDEPVTLPEHSRPPETDIAPSGTPGSGE